MTDWFAEPNSTDMEGIYSFFRYTNTVAEGLLFPVILLVIWVITFVSMLASGNISRPSAAKAWVFASFFTTISAVLLTMLNLVARKYMYILLVLLGFGVIWIILENAKE